MLEFLRKNWVWVALPIAVFLAVLVYVLVFTDEEGAAPIGYSIF